jgi:hypothetical protein
VALERVRRAWGDVPELACAEAWRAASRAWWDDEEDGRLRAASREALWLRAEEVAEWLGRRLDTHALIRAHCHVTATRAGVEADLSRRTLVTGELRNVPVWTDHHDGTRRMFAAVGDVPRLLERAYADARELPDHPFIRAAWMSQMLGVVHPFRDANGGTARFLASLELARSWLPPFVLSPELRNGAYIEAVAMRDSLDPLAVVVYEAVQQTLAGALLARGGPAAVWDQQSQGRAAAWGSVADEVVRAAVGEGLAVERADGADAAIARFVRAGYRLPQTPAARTSTWNVASPVPAQVDLAIVPLRAGPASWLCAVVAGRAGEHAELGTVIVREFVARYFVAPAGEDYEVATPRFQRWMTTRVEQTVRGIARWM